MLQARISENQSLRASVQANQQQAERFVADKQACEQRVMEAETVVSGSNENRESAEE